MIHNSEVCGSLEMGVEGGGMTGRAVSKWGYSKSKLMHAYAHIHIPVILGMCLCLLFMLFPKTVSSMNAGMFVPVYSGNLIAYPSICQIAVSPSLLRSVGDPLLPVGMSHSL